MISLLITGFIYLLISSGNDLLFAQNIFSFNKGHSFNILSANFRSKCKSSLKNTRSESLYADKLKQKIYNIEDKKNSSEQLSYILRSALSRIEESLKAFNFKAAEEYEFDYLNKNILEEFNKEKTFLFNKYKSRYISILKKKLNLFFVNLSKKSWQIKWNPASIPYFPTLKDYLNASIKETSIAALKKRLINELNKLNSLDQKRREKINKRFRENSWNELNKLTELELGRTAQQLYPSFKLHFPAKQPYLPAIPVFEKDIIEFKPILNSKLYWPADVVNPSRINRNSSAYPLALKMNYSLISEFDCNSIISKINNFYSRFSENQGQFGHIFLQNRRDSLLLYGISAPKYTSKEEYSIASGGVLLIKFIGDTPVAVGIDVILNNVNYGCGGNFNSVKLITRDIAYTLFDAFMHYDNLYENNHKIESIELKLETPLPINTTPDKNNKCILKITVKDAKGKPVKNRYIKFLQPELGSLSKLKVLTNQYGEAKVIYTAPTDKDLQNANKVQANISIMAIDTETAKSSSVIIRINSKIKKIATQVKYQIMPAYPLYYNEISFSFRAINRPYKKPYKAIITVNSGSGGAIVKSYGDTGGKKIITMDVKPNRIYRLYYHWIGLPTMNKAFDETITIRIPQLKLKKQINFSVGIDLAIESVQTAFQSNYIYAAIFNPLKIFVVDRFHPGADLVKIFKDFDLTIDLKITQAAFIPAPPDPDQEAFLSALFTAWEGSSSYPKTDPVIFDGDLWDLKKTKNSRFIVVFKGKSSGGKSFVQYPGINVFERGSYQFNIKINSSKFDANPTNNHALTDILKVKGFASEGQEIMHTVLLPSIQFLLLSLTDIPLVKVGSKAKTIITAINLGLTSDSTIKDVKNRRWDKVFIDVFSMYLSALDGSKLSDTAKQLVKDNTLALYTYTLVETLTSYSKPHKKTTHQLFKLNLMQSAYASQLKKATKRYKKSELYKVIQLSLKASNNHYIIILNRSGLSYYRIKNSKGLVMQKAVAKMYINGKINQRIYEGKNNIVLSANNTENIILNLRGNSKAGQITVITKDKITHYSYPHKKWQQIIEIDSSGKIKFNNSTDSNIKNARQISGRWKTNFGLITIKQTKNKISGTYTHDNGKIEGTLKGNILYGVWKEAPSYKPKRDAGALEFIFSKDFKSFKGHWRYGFKSKSWDGQWSGKKIK